MIKTSTNLNYSNLLESTMNTSDYSMLECTDLLNISQRELDASTSSNSPFLSSPYEDPSEIYPWTNKDLELNATHTFQRS